MEWELLKVVDGGGGVMFSPDSLERYLWRLAAAGSGNCLGKMPGEAKDS